MTSWAAGSSEVKVFWCFGVERKVAELHRNTANRLVEQRDALETIRSSSRGNHDRWKLGSQICVRLKDVRRRRLGWWTGPTRFPQEIRDVCYLWWVHFLLPATSQNSV